MKDKKGITVINTFQNILDESIHKATKCWVDEVSEFYHRSMKSWFKDNDIELYLTLNEGKSVVAEIFIRTLKNKI